MSGKRKLEDLLSQEGQLEIRRGQGVRLSTEQSVPAHSMQTIAPVEDAKSHHRKNASSHQIDMQPEEKVQRVNRGYKLREDLIRNYKRLALDRGQHLYEVMEAALQEYLDRQKKPGAS